MKFLLNCALGLILLSTSSVFASKVTCNETKQHLGYYERFVFTFNDKNQVTDIDDFNWNAKTDTRSGHGVAGYTPKKPLSGKINGDTITFQYVTQDEGDGDYPGPVNDIKATLPKSGNGAGRVQIDYDKGTKGSDEYVLSCSSSNNNSGSEATKPSDQCMKLAVSIVKSTISLTSGPEVAKTARYDLTNYKGAAKADLITIQAFGLGGEDSDSYEEYSLELRKSPGSKTCGTLIKMSLVSEN